MIEVHRMATQSFDFSRQRIVHRYYNDLGAQLGKTRVSDPQQVEFLAINQRICWVKDLHDFVNVRTERFG